MSEQSQNINTYVPTFYRLAAFNSVLSSVDIIDKAIDPILDLQLTQHGKQIRDLTTNTRHAILSSRTDDQISLVNVDSTYTYFNTISTNQLETYLFNSDEWYIDTFSNVSAVIVENLSSAGIHNIVLSSSDAQITISTNVSGLSTQQLDVSTSVINLSTQHNIAIIKSDTELSYFNLYIVLDKLQ